MTDCSICLEIISRKQIILTCNHVFHTKCIREWIKNKKTCPLCRAKNNLVIPQKPIQYKALVQKIKNTTIEFTDDIFETSADMSILRNRIDGSEKFAAQFNNYFEILEQEKLEELTHLMLYYASMKDLMIMMENREILIPKKAQKLNIIKLLYRRPDVQDLVFYDEGVSDEDDSSDESLDYDDNLFYNFQN